MSIDLEERTLSASDDADLIQYRSLNTLAVVSLGLGLISPVAIMDMWAIKAVPVCGIILGVLSLVQIRRAANEYSGALLAKIGVVASLLFLVGGFALSAYTYATEVPEGYQRITYDDLQPDPAAPQAEIPPRAAELDGQRVFIKGYAYQPAGGFDVAIEKFMLVRDRDKCCFGGKPKITDMILVRLRGNLRLTWSLKVQKLAGTFHVEPGQSVDGLGACLYRLDADYLE